MKIYRLTIVTQVTYCYWFSSAVVCHAMAVVRKEFNIFNFIFKIQSQLLHVPIASL